MLQLRQVFSLSDTTDSVVLIAKALLMWKIRSVDVES